MFPGQRQQRGVFTRDLRAANKEMQQLLKCYFLYHLAAAGMASAVFHHHLWLTPTVLCRCCAGTVNWYLPVAVEIHYVN